MATTDIASRLTPYVEQLLEDKSARKDLRQGATKLREAYARSQKRRVKAAKDPKLRRQMLSAVQSIGEGANALARDLEKPKRRGRKRLLVLLVLGAGGVAAALVLSDDLRSSLFGEESPGQANADGGPR